MLRALISTLFIAGVFFALSVPITHAEESGGTTTEEILIPDESEPAETATTTEEASAPEESSGASSFAEPPLDPTTFYNQIFFPNHQNRINGLRIRQTAGKDGDQFYLSPIIDHAAATISVLVDFSRIFGEVDVPLEDVFDQYDQYTSSNLLRQFQGGPYTIASGGFNGIVSVLMTATDEFGAIAQETFDILLDHTLPTLSFTSISRSSTERLKQADVLLLSGTLDGTGSGARLYNIQKQELSADGTTVLAQSTYGSTHPASPELYALRGGAFTDVPLRVHTASGLADFPENVAGVRYVFTFEDEAGNLAYATTSTIALDYTVEPPPPPPGPQISNVLFLPGIKGSRLYHQVSICDGVPGTCDETLWEPYGDALARKLFLGVDGNSENDVFVKEGEIIDEVGGQKFYSTFMQELNEKDATDEYGAAWQWRPVAYDWRLSLPDIVNNGAKYEDRIYYDQATSTPYIEQTLRELARSSSTGKVTIVAHSNGGLVAKALMQKLGDSETAILVDKVILVGSPQSGAPQALGALLFGHGEGLPGKPYLPNILISPKVSRELAENSPMAYHLIPSYGYLQGVQDPNHSIIGFSGSHLYQAEQGAYGPSIDTLDELDDFLLAREGGRTKPAFADLTIANILNPNLISYANDTHTSLDSWTPPASVSVYQIAGWGANTVSGIDFYDEQKLLGATIGYKRQYRPVFVEDGDGVVPVPSALAISTAPNVHNYWLNLKATAEQLRIEYDHGSIFETVSTRQFIADKLQNLDVLPSFITPLQPTETSPAKKLIFQLHSPLTLGLYDSSGNYTGLNEDGSVSEQVGGVEYGEFGDVKYLIAPAGTEYELVMNGQTDGTFSLDIQEQDGDTLTTTTIADVPTTASTVARITITNGVADSSTLAVDSDGDGATDIQITPVSGETVQYEVPASNEEVATAVVEASTGSGASLATALAFIAPTPTLPSFPVTPTLNPRVLGAEINNILSVQDFESVTESNLEVQTQTASVYDAFVPFAEWIKTLLYNVWQGTLAFIKFLFA